MAGELGAMPYGFQVSMHFQATDPAANATTALITDLTGTGYNVPAGYQFHPMLLQVTADTAVTAQSATFTVTDNAAAIANGPSVVLSTVAPTTRDAQIVRLGISPIAAGHTVGVQVVTPTGYTPTTDDYDVVLTGVLEPV